MQYYDDTGLPVKVKTSPFSPEHLLANAPPTRTSYTTTASHQPLSYRFQISYKSLRFS